MYIAVKCEIKSNLFIPKLNWYFSLGNTCNIEENTVFTVKMCAKYCQRQTIGVLFTRISSMQLDYKFHAEMKTEQ
jgi:hypothetical protein